MKGKEQLMKFVDEQIYEQQKGFEESMSVQIYLKELWEKLGSSTSYEDFIQSLVVQEENEEETFPTYRAITNFIRTMLREQCDSKARVEYMLIFMKEMISELNEAVKASRVYERIKG